MKTFTVAVHYRGPQRPRTKVYDQIEAMGMVDARERGRERFIADRASNVNRTRLVDVKITRVTAAPNPVVKHVGLVEKADVLDQIKALIATPAPLADQRIGKVVCKTGGDYQFQGVIVGVVTKLSGVERFVVEDSRGLLLIMNSKQVGL